MLNTIFRKTLYERRWSIFGWSLAVGLMTLLTVSIFPTMRDSFGASLENVPESMKALLGSAEDYQTLAGFVDLQVLAQMIFLTLIFGVILGVGLLAGDEGDGTLQQLLTTPVSRSRVYLEKMAAMMVSLGVVTVVLWLSIFVGSLALGETLDQGRLILACAMLWLLTLVFSILAYSLGAITGKRGVAGAVAGMVAFTAYMINALAPSVDLLSSVNKLLPFHYFNNPSVLRVGMDWGNVGVLGTACFVMALVGYVIFVRRDIYQP